MLPEPGPRLLAVFAHLDDESFRCGGTLALLARRGCAPLAPALHAHLRRAAAWGTAHLAFPWAVLDMHTYRKI